ncbi:MAG: SurA N-terminal domain-containing protein [Bacteroidales bacterium]|nr:SurA N-terminal domain-containing protein [Bacteroidales bacterium]
MAVLEKIRVRMGVFISVIIGLALLSFIIDPSTLQSAMSMFSSKYDVGKMNGKSISYQDFSRKIDHYTRIQQLITGASSLDERSAEMVQQRAWQDCLDELVLFPAIKKAGITLSEEELFDLTQGKEISPVLQQEPIFSDESGLFSRSKVIQFVQSASFDNTGTTALYWQYLESNITQVQLYTKYSSLLEKSAVLNNIELRRNIEENNATSDVRFVMMPISFFIDTTTAVTTQEVRDYYEKNKSLYEQEASRDIDYVQFTIVPSLSDIDRAEVDFQKYFEEFSTTKNLKLFLSRNSDKAFDTYYYKEGELASVAPVLDSFAFKATMADVLPVTREGDRFFSARLESVKTLPDSAFVQHILLSSIDGSRADSLVNVLKRGGDFDALASRFSLAPVAGDKAGELGWMTAQMFEGVLDTCLTAPINTPFSLPSQYGIHVLRVTKKTKPLKKVQLAVYEKTAIAGKETYQMYYGQANELVTKSNNKEALFTQIASENDWFVYPAVGIAEGAKTVANIPNARELSRWAFEAKQGDVSPIITIDNKYFIVAALTGVHEKGLAPIASKRYEIEMEVRREKEVKQVAKRLKDQMAQVSDIEMLADYARLPVSRQSGIAFGSLGMQQLEPKFIGAVSGAPLHTLAGPVEGSIGAYVFTVDDRQTGFFYTEEDAKRQLHQIMGQQNQIALFLVLPKAAKVVDNRAKFF